MASATIFPSPPTNRYSTFRRPSTLEGPEYNDTGTPGRLIAKMKGVGLPITDPVRNFAHMMTKELQEEEKRSRDATDTFTNVSKRLSALENLVWGIPKLQEKVKEIPGLRQQVEEIPSLRKQVEEIPSLRQQLDQIPSLRQQLDQIPSLRQQLDQLQSRIQELEHKSKKIHSVTTKGRYATFRELMKWGVTQNRVVNKTVRAYNRKIAASGRERARVGNVKRETSIVLPFLSMELHVGDMIDWQAALASIPNNLASDYPLSICLAETAFKEIFGFHPTEAGSGIFQNEQCGKSNYNLASSLILYSPLY